MVSDDIEFHGEVPLGISSYGNDTPPLMSSVPEPPPSHWGKTTSEARTASPQYIEFLKRHRESKQNG